MKKIILLVLYLFILTSCNKSDSNPVTADSALDGTWVLSSISETTSQGLSTLTPSQANISMTIVFNSDKTCLITIVSDGQTSNGKEPWSTSNGNLKFTFGINTYTLPYTITVNKVDIDFSSLIPILTNTSDVTITKMVFEFARQ